MSADAPGLSERAPLLEPAPERGGAWFSSSSRTPRGSPGSGGFGGFFFNTRRGGVEDTLPVTWSVRAKRVVSGALIVASAGLLVALGANALGVRLPTVIVERALSREMPSHNLEPVDVHGTIEHPDRHRLEAVDFTGKAILIVSGLPYSGTSALEGLISTAPHVTDLCAAGMWQCEDTLLMEQYGFKEPSERRFDPGIITAEQYAYAFKDFAIKWWDMSKTLLMDKTPNLIMRYERVKAAADMLGVPVKFVILTRHPFSWTSKTHPFNQEDYYDMMRHVQKLLHDDTIDKLQIRYEDLAERLPETIKQLEAFLPRAGGSFDPHKSGLSSQSGGERGLGVADYFKQNPMDWERRPLMPKVKQLLCTVGYNGEGECNAFQSDS